MKRLWRQQHQEKFLSSTWKPQGITGPHGQTQGLDTSGSGQFGDGDAAFDPHGVHAAERRQPVLEVAELLAVHEHTETAPLAANLQLRTHIHTRRSGAAAGHRGATHSPLVTLKGWSLMKGKKGTSCSASPQDPDTQARRTTWRSRKRAQSSSATSDGGSPEAPQPQVRAM